MWENSGKNAEKKILWKFPEALGDVFKLIVFFWAAVQAHNEHEQREAVNLTLEIVAY